MYEVKIMATYNQIIDYVKNKYSITVQTCWIADMKEKCGLSLREAPNRINKNKRQKPCPVQYEKYIKDAFSYFKMI